MTYDEKRMIMDRILAVWAADPHQRLGQLLLNAVCISPVPQDDETAQDQFFFMDDSDLVAWVEKFAELNR